jgi:hypothetical protein
MLHEITCISCHKKVETELVSYGTGWIAACPICQDLAYNSNMLPKVEGKGVVNLD